MKLLERNNQRIFAILFVEGLLGVLAALPFRFDLIENRAFGQTPVPDIPLPFVVALALLQNGVLLALIIVFGMILSERLGFRMPLIRAWANGEPHPDMKAIVLPGMVVACCCRRHLGWAGGAFLSAASARANATNF